MTAFDSIASIAAREEARARDVATAATARVEVVVNKRHGVLAALCCLVIAGGAYWEGRVDGSARYDAEHARFEGFIADERTKATEEHARQAAALRDVQAASDLRAEQSATATTDLQSRIDAYVAQLQHRPVDARCTLTDADLHGLRDLAPGAARPHRRPARAAAHEE